MRHPMMRQDLAVNVFTFCMTHHSIFQYAICVQRVDFSIFNYRFTQFRSCVLHFRRSSGVWTNIVQLLFIIFCLHANGILWHRNIIRAPTFHSDPTNIISIIFHLLIMILLLLIIIYERGTCAHRVGHSNTNSL